MGDKAVGRNDRRGVMNRLNARLFTAAQRYYETMGEAARAVGDAVQASGLFMPEVAWRALGYECADRYMLDCGEGVTVLAALYRMPSGRYEVTAYAS